MPLPKSKHISTGRPVSKPVSVKEFPKQVAAAQAKTNLLQMLSSVREAGEYVITKRGKPVAKLIPFSVDQEQSIYGCMRGTGRIIGDVISPLPSEEWGDSY